MKHKTDIRDYTRAFYKGNRLNFLGSLVFSMLCVIPTLVFSWLLGEILDIITRGDLSALLRIIAFTVPSLFLTLGMALCYGRLRCRFLHRAIGQYKALAFSRLSRKSISAFTRENTGRYLSALTNDANTIENDYLAVSVALVQLCIMFAATLVMMFWYSWVLALAAVLLSLLPVAVSLLMGGELARRQRAVSDKNESFVSKVKDMLGGFSVIKSFKAEGQMEELFSSANRAAEHVKKRSRWWRYLLNAVADVSGIIVQFGIFLIGAWLAIRGDITGGTVLVMVNLCNFILQPVNTVPQYWADRKAARALIEKLARAVEENTGSGGRAVEPVLSDAIELEHLSFGYEPDQPVLKDVSLRFEAGKKYAVVGSSGSGKSTLLNLLMGAYNGYEGSLTIDGQELREISTDSLYDLTSLIGQSVFLFDDTLKNNITMFRKFPQEHVDMAVKRSGLSELVAQRGLDYKCGENGVNLSGGERQRVSIARCLLRGTPVLLLDEATAALDNRTAFAVTDAILHLDGLTRVVVTHRLDAALLEQYDGIIVLRDGQILEQGAFGELMDRKGYFYSLFTLAA